MSLRTLAPWLAACWLAGFPAAADEESLEDLLGGFEEEATAPETEPAAGSEPEPAWDPLRGEFWELSGSVSLASSINFRPHNSVAKHTNYLGLSKLRSRLNLQLDLDLPADWELRAQGFAYYDWAYLIRGRSDYTDAVLRKYEWDADTQDLWIRGTPFENFDVKLGRQVVNWGRSETLRVLDILNPVDNREPGVADIEDLRRAITMGRFDYYLGDWNLSVVAIPEIRFHQNPPPGSDFNPSPLFLPPPSPPGIPIIVTEDKPDSLEHWETALRAHGIFEGWDLSFQFAYYYDDFAVLQSLTPPLVLKHHRLWMLGSGANFTIGSWLLKGEIAFIDGIGFTDADDKFGLDVMAGVEYYGFTDTTISVEALNRHIFDFPNTVSVGSTAGVAQENATSGAIRVTRSFLRERLDATLLAALIMGDEKLGGVVRLEGSYDLMEALVLTAGVVLYMENDLPPLSTYGKNDRFFFELKWSF